MTDLRLPDKNKWGKVADSELVAFFHSRVGELFHKRVRESGKSWEESVFDPSLAITRGDLDRIEQDLLDTGYRYTYSAQVSIVEAPEKYKSPEPLEVIAEGAVEVAEAQEEEPGRRAVGTGSNVSKRPETVFGVTRFIRKTETVMQMLVEGVPEDTIAVIDDAGGTLTAPILEDFKGIICLGGTVRSHLAILAREYATPCLMDSRFEGLAEGDRVELEVTADRPSAAGARLAEGQRARIWKLE